MNRHQPIVRSPATTREELVAALDARPEFYRANDGNPDIGLILDLPMFHSRGPGAPADPDFIEQVVRTQCSALRAMLEFWPDHVILEGSREGATITPRRHEIDAWRNDAWNRILLDLMGGASNTEIIEGNTPETLKSMFGRPVAVTYALHRISEGDSGFQLMAEMTEETGLRAATANAEIRASDARMTRRQRMALFEDREEGIGEFARTVRGCLCAPLGAAHGLGRTLRGSREPLVIRRVMDLDFASPPASDQAAIDHYRQLVRDMDGSIRAKQLPGVTDLDAIEAPHADSDLIFAWLSPTEPMACAVHRADQIHPAGDGSAYGFSILSAEGCRESDADMALLIEVARRCREAGFARCVASVAPGDDVQAWHMKQAGWAEGQPDPLDRRTFFKDLKPTT